VQGGAGGITPHTVGSRAGRCTSEKRTGTHYTGGWVGLRAGLEGSGKYCPPGFEPRTVQPMASRHADRVRTDSLNTINVKGSFSCVSCSTGPRFSRTIQMITDTDTVRSSPSQRSLCQSKLLLILDCDQH
jgi:hypothetical protein